MELQPGHTPDELRDTAREVALTYRRVGRAGKAAGLSPPQYEERAKKAAFAKYVALVPEAAASDRLDVTHRANVIIVNAINKNIDGSGAGRTLRTTLARSFDVEQTRRIVADIHQLRDL